MMPDKNAAFSSYAELASRYGQSSQGLPAQVDIAPVKTVICLQIMGAGFGIPLEEMAELLEMPPCTRLPRVKSWVRGVANVRGKLLPVIDFADFLGGQLLTPPNQHRIVVLDLNGLYVGLLVDRVLGMRHFRVDDYNADAVSDIEAVAPFVSGAFNEAGDSWYMLRPLTLAQDPRFMDVSL